MFDRGLVTIARFGGSPVRLHWTAPFGVVLFALPAIAPGAWLGVALVLVGHLLGRLVVARMRGLGTAGVRLHGLGGDAYHPGASAGDRAAIAWGGILGQLALAALAAIIRGGEPNAAGFGPDLAGALVTGNLILAGLHLLVPVGPFSGRDIWRGQRGHGGRGRGGAPLTSRELRRRQERAMADGPPPDAVDDAEITDSIQAALRQAAQDSKKRKN